MRLPWVVYLYLEAPPTHLLAKLHEHGLELLELVKHQNGHAEDFHELRALLVHVHVLEKGLRERYM